MAFNKKILLVDDEKDILEFLSYNLKKENFEVFTANNGKEGLKIAKEMRALRGKINEAKLKIKKATQTKDGPIVIDDYWTRKICLLNIKLWANDYLTLKKELDINIRKRVSRFKYHHLSRSIYCL